MNRDLQGGLVYMNTRLERLEKMAWETCKVIPPGIKDKLSANELNYFN